MKVLFIISLILFQCAAFSQVAENRNINKRDQLLYLIDSLHSCSLDTRMDYGDLLYGAVAQSNTDNVANYRSAIQEEGFKMVETIIGDYGWPDPLTISYKIKNAFIYFLINAPVSKRKTILNKLTHSLVKVERYNYATILKESLENRSSCGGWGSNVAANSVETKSVDNSLTLQSWQANRISNISFSKLQLQTINFKLQNETNTLRPTRQY